MFDFSWDEEDFSQSQELNPEFRSHLDPKLRRIIANNSHPDYLKECQLPDRREDYFRILTSKELALYTYSKANLEDLAEGLIETEICVKRYL